MPIIRLDDVSHDLLDALRPIYGNNTRDEILSMALSELLYQSTRPAPDRRHHLEVPMVLIEIRSPQGIHAWCDAQCYDADGESCTCPCGGANHARGLAAALNNIPSLVASRVPDLWIQSQADALPPGCQAFAQMPLWVDVNSYTTVAAIALELNAARASQANAGKRPPPTNAGAE